MPHLPATPGRPSAAHDATLPPDAVGPDGPTDVIAEQALVRAVPPDQTIDVAATPRPVVGHDLTLPPDPYIPHGRTDVIAQHALLRAAPAVPPDQTIDVPHEPVPPADLPIDLTIDVPNSPSPARRGAAPPPEIYGYALFDEIGRGGMGVVYRGRQTTLNREVAVKLALGDRADSKELIRFLAEAQAAAEVRHPHVVEVYQFGECGGRPFLAMEYCPGGCLADRLKKAGRMDPHAAARLLAQVADGVAAAHAAGIVHRDLKPNNILFDAAGRPKVADFGLAKRGGGSDLTRTNAMMGTPAFMAPEQADGRAKFAGPPTDVWALGVMLYELLTGRRPFDAEETFALLRQIRDAHPAAPRSLSAEVPWELELVCLKALSKEPHDRYPTAREFGDDLRNWLAGRPIAARPTSGLTKAWKWARRNRALSAALAGTVFASTAGTGVSVWFLTEAREREREAREYAERARQSQESAERHSAEVTRLASELQSLRDRYTQAALGDKAELERLQDEMRAKTAELNRIARARMNEQAGPPARPTPVPPREQVSVVAPAPPVAPPPPPPPPVPIVPVPGPGGSTGAAVAGVVAVAAADETPGRLLDWLDWEAARIAAQPPPRDWTVGFKASREKVWERLENWPIPANAGPLPAARLAVARGRFVAVNPSTYIRFIPNVWDESRRGLTALGPKASADDTGYVALLGMSRLFVPEFNDLWAKSPGQPADPLVETWAAVFELADAALEQNPNCYPAARTLGTLLRLVDDQPERYQAVARAAAERSAACRRRTPAELPPAVEQHLRTAADHAPVWNPSPTYQHADYLFRFTVRRVFAFQQDADQAAAAMADVVARGQRAVDRELATPDQAYKLMGLAAEDGAWLGGDPTRYAAALGFYARATAAAKPDNRRLHQTIALDRGRCLYRAAVFGPVGQHSAAAAVDALTALADALPTDTPADAALAAEAHYFRAHALWAAGRTGEAAAAFNRVAALPVAGDVAWVWLAHYHAGRLAVATRSDPTMRFVREQAEWLKRQRKNGYYELLEALAALATDDPAGRGEAVNQLERLAYVLTENSNRDGFGDQRASEPFQHAMAELTARWADGGRLDEAAREKLRTAFRDGVRKYPWVLTAAEKDRLGLTPPR